MYVELFSGLSYLNVDFILGLACMRSYGTCFMSRVGQGKDWESDLCNACAFRLYASSSTCGLFRCWICLGCLIFKNLYDNGDMIQDGLVGPGCEFQILFQKGFGDCMGT